MNSALLFLAQVLNDVSSDTAEAGSGTALTLFSVFGLALSTFLVITIFWFIALIHLIQNEDVKDRTLWIVLLFVAGGIVGVVYYFAVKMPYDKEKLNKAKK